MENKDINTLDKNIIWIIILMLESTLGSMSSREADEIVFKVVKILKAII